MTLFRPEWKGDKSGGWISTVELLFNREFVSAFIGEKILFDKSTESSVGQSGLIQSDWNISKNHGLPIK